MDVREPPSDAMTAVVYIASFTTLCKIGIWAMRMYHP